MDGRRHGEDPRSTRRYVIGDSDHVSWNKKSSLDVLVRAYLIFRLERVRCSDESSSSMTSKATAGIMPGNTNIWSLVEETNTLLSDSMTVEAIVSKEFRY